MNPDLLHPAHQYNGFNQLLSVSGPSGTTSFSYDGNGNQVSKTDGFGTTSYAYSYDNRLVGISGPAGSSYFEYDANGLRTKKTDSTGTRSYLLDGLSVVAEYAPDASKLAWYTQSLARIDEVLSVVNGQGKYWYETDALGSTYAMTSATGAVVSRSSYDVFGERALAAGADLGQPFGFTGREHDQGGLVYARARYLQPGVGRWTAADPMGLVDGTNRYWYVRGRPSLAVDPTGLFAARLHNFIAQSAASPWVTQADVPAIRAASEDADGAQYQSPENSFRHGMRAPLQPIDVAIHDWIRFVLARLARAAELYECDKNAALLALGHGFHAVSDAEVAVHRFLPWEPWNVVAVAAHGAYEQDLRQDDVDTQAAILAARYYFDAFAAVRRSARLGALHFAEMYYGLELRLHASDLVGR